MTQTDRTQDPPNFDEQKARQLRFAVALTAIVFVGELIGGLWTGSLALLSDAGHVFSDVFSLVLSLFAVALACRPPTDRHNYGLHRAEVLAALVNGLTLVVICGFILHKAWQRLLEPTEIKSLEMLGIAAIGLVANWIVAARLAGHSHQDINLRSAYLHVLGDLFASVGVVVAGIIIALTNWTTVDPIVSAGIALWILVNALKLIGEATHILLEGVPRGVDIQEVADALTELPEVDATHQLHAWSICSNILALSGHIVTCPKSEEERVATRGKIEDILTSRFRFSHTTLEFESEACSEGGLLKPLEHGMPVGRRHDHDHDHGH